MSAKVKKYESQLKKIRAKRRGEEEDDISSISGGSASEEEVEEVEREHTPAVENVQYQHSSFEDAGSQAESTVAEADPKAAPFVRRMGKIGRNDACPCGSGKKYKHCHGKLS